MAPRGRRAAWIGVVVAAICAGRLILALSAPPPARPAVAAAAVLPVAVVRGDAGRANSGTAGAGAADEAESGRIAVVTLVMRGRLASSDVESLLCAPLVMWHSVRQWASFAFDQVALVGFLGAPCANVTGQPLRRCKRAQLEDPGFWAPHDAAVVRLRAALAPKAVRVWEGVTREAALQHAALVEDILFVKLRVLELLDGDGAPYARLLFLDADVIAVADPAAFVRGSGAQLAAYQTCTTPFNAGCFALRAAAVAPGALGAMEAAYLRARPSCDTPAFFAGGYDGRPLGSPPWPGAALCPGRQPVLSNETWRFHTACIADQGLPFFHFARVVGSYAALNYTDAPVLHWNGVGPKPWAEPAVTDVTNHSHGRRSGRSTGRRQGCWWLWWAAYDSAVAQGALDGLPCARTLATARAALAPAIADATAAAENGTGPPCYKCVGGGHASCWPNCTRRFLSERCVRVQLERTAGRDGAARRVRAGPA